MLNSDLSTMNDDALVRLCWVRGSKDDRPFAELFRRHRGYVWNICYRFAGNGQDAEDLVQEIFFKAHRGIAKFEGRSSFRTWLHRIAINTCKNEIRRRHRRPLEALIPLEDLSERLVDEGNQEGDWSERLHQALVQLRTTDRHALRLRDIEGRSYQEISQQLDIGVSAAKMRVARARVALHEAIQLMEQEG